MYVHTNPQTGKLILNECHEKLVRKNFFNMGSPDQILTSFLGLQQHY